MAQKPEHGGAFSPAEISLEQNNKQLQAELGLNLADCATITELQAPELPKSEIFSLNITDQAAWKSAEKEQQLLKTFGKLCFVAFEPRENTAVYNPNDPEVRAKAISDLAEIKECQKIVVIAENGNTVAFAGSLLRQQGDIKMSVLSLIVVDPEKRGGAYAKFLSKDFLSQENVDAFSAITHTPAAIKALVDQDKTLGHTSYFCGQKFGEWGNHGNKEEQEAMRQLDKIVRDNYVEEYGDRAISGEPGYLGITKLGQKGVIDPIPPVQESELRFKSGDLLGETFRKGLIRKNEDYAPHTMYGIYVSFKGK